MLRTLTIHLRSLFRRQAVDRDLDEELRSHVDVRSPGTLRVA